MSRKEIKFNSSKRSHGSVLDLADHIPTTSKGAKSKQQTRPLPSERNKKKVYRKGKIRNAFKKTYSEYCTESTVHGVPYLIQSNKLPDILFWLILLVISIGICVSQVKSQYSRWRTAPVILSFSEVPTPVSEIPFPAVTICSETKSIKTETINFTRFYHHLKSFQGKVVQQPEWLNDDEFLKMRALLHVCGNFLVKDLIFPEYPPMRVMDQLNQIAPPFDQHFIYCVFNKSAGACAPYFDKTYSEEGICYTFNSLNVTEVYRQNTFQYEYFGTDDHIRQRKEILDWSIDRGYLTNEYDTYPERVIGSGIKGGLLITIRERIEHLDFVCRGPVMGLKLILHSPDEVPQVDKHFIHVPYQSDMLILIRPHFVYTTDNVDDYSPEERQCYYPEERYLQFFKLYTQNNCEIECLANFTLRRCKCVQFSMPRLPQTAVCDASMISCYDKAESEFLLFEYTNLGQADKKCNCLPGCYILQYDHEMSQGHLNIINSSREPDDHIVGIYKRFMTSRLRMYFRANDFTAWKRAELFGYAHFFANCGGLFGLFMGISALSVVELFYHFTVRLYDNVQAMKSSQGQAKKINFNSS